MPKIVFTTEEGGADKASAPFPVSIVATGMYKIDFHDYQMSEIRRKEFERAPIEPDKPVHDATVVVTDDTYLSSSETKNKFAAFKEKVKLFAKEIYDENRQYIADYEEACLLVNKASEDEINFPSQEMVRALKIKDRGRPMTKEKAIQIATAKAMAQEEKR